MVSVAVDPFGISPTEMHLAEILFGAIVRGDGGLLNILPALLVATVLESGKQADEVGAGGPEPLDY